MHGKGPVRYRQSGGPESPLAIGIDFRFARSPESYTYADCVSLKNDKETGISSILFGQTDKNSVKGIESIRIVMPSSSLFGQFVPSAKGVEEALASQLKALKLQSANRQVPAEAVVRATRFANCIFLATSVGEGALDFYYMPGRDIHFARLYRSEIDLEPLIRVIMPLPVLQYLFELCRPFVQSPGVAVQDPRSTHRANAI